MAIRTYKVTLDSKNAIAPEPVLLRQGDKTGAVVIDATLMDNGVPVSLDGITPMFKANTADGQAVIADSTGFKIVNASGGEFTYQVPNALSSVPGKITTAYFSFSDSYGSESTFDVAFIIKKAVDITKPQADDYIAIIDGTIQSLQQKIDAMNTDVQTILNAYNQGDFYNKSETDSKDSATFSNAKTYTDNSLSGIVALPETFANLAAIQAKYPNGANGVMVTADTGHKYIWANSTWTDAGVYQSTGLADGSVTPSKIVPCSMFPIVYCVGRINVNTITKMIEFPSGRVMLPNGNAMTGIQFAAQSIQYSNTGWLVYDLDSGLIKINNDPSGNVATIGWISIDGWLSINGATVARDGQLATQGGTISTFATPLIWSPPESGNIIYDAKAATVRFPKSFGLTYGVESISLLTKSNGGTVDDVISITSTGFLIYVPATKNIALSGPGLDNIVLGYVDTVRKQVQLNTKVVEIINDKNLKITYLGDSITEGVHTSKRYLEYIEDKLTDQSYDVTTVNLGIGGTTIASSSDRPNGFVTRWQDIPSDSDVIVVFGGTNDYGASIPMGEMTDDKTTFKGALNELITSIQNAYPNADLLVLTPIKRYFRNSVEHWTGEDTWQDGDKWKNNKGLLLSDYVDAIKEVAGHNGAKVIDLYDNSGFNPRVQANYNRNTSDGLHPNAVGHYLLYKQIYPEVLNCANNREQVTDPNFHN